MSCVSCHLSTLCKDCISCYFCKGCDSCINCVECDNSYFCIGCESVINCKNCINARHCLGWKNIQNYDAKPFIVELLSLYKKYGKNRHNLINYKDLKSLLGINIEGDIFHWDQEKGKFFWIHPKTRGIYYVDLDGKYRLFLNYQPDILHKLITREYTLKKLLPIEFLLNIGPSPVGTD